MPAMAFKTAAAWERWLAENSEASNGIWLKLYKKGSCIESVTYDEALDEALCYGWIDGQLKPCDEESYLRKFTPRRRGSLWSKRNIGHVERLTAAGKMKSPGMKEVQEALTDGRWSNAYDPQSGMVIPADFLHELSKNKRAESFFATLSKANTYSIGWRLQTAQKVATREKRLKAILGMLERGEKFHL